MYSEQGSAAPAGRPGVSVRPLVGPLAVMGMLAVVCVLAVVAALLTAVTGGPASAAPGVPAVRLHPAPDGRARAEHGRVAPFTVERRGLLRPLIPAAPGTVGRVFSVAEREDVLRRLLAAARADPGISGAALVGSSAVDAADRWSDLDVALGVEGPLGAALERWTGLLYRNFGAVHHWDLPSGSTVYRVFLLPGWLEVDLSFTPAAGFGPRGPRWRTVFGRTVTHEPGPPPEAGHLAGLAWHHALHARTCIERGRMWQAEYWISGLRDHLIALACLRSGHPTGHAKGAHLLPTGVTAPLESALVRSLDALELRRALGVALAALARELDATDPELSNRLRPMLADLARKDGDTPARA